MRDYVTSLKTYSLMMELRFKLKSDLKGHAIHHTLLDILMASGVNICVCAPVCPCGYLLINNFSHGADGNRGGGCADLLQTLCSDWLTSWLID